jgi:hypothetical protein
MEIDETISAGKWFRKYKSDDKYGVAIRDFKALCIIHGQERHKVVDCYRQNGNYYLVYLKKPVVEKTKMQHGFTYFDEAGC